MRGNSRGDILSCHASTTLLAAMQEGFATVSGNMAKAMSVAFKSINKADLEILTGKLKRKISLIRGQAPRKLEAGRGQQQKLVVHSHYRSGCVCQTLSSLTRLILPLMRIKAKCLAVARSGKQVK